MLESPSTVTLPWAPICIPRRIIDVLSYIRVPFQVKKTLSSILGAKPCFAHHALRGFSMSVSTLTLTIKALVFGISDVMSSWVTGALAPSTPSVDEAFAFAAMRASALARNAANSESESSFASSSSSSGITTGEGLDGLTAMSCRWLALTGPGPSVVSWRCGLESSSSESSSAMTSDSFCGSETLGHVDGARELGDECFGTGERSVLLRLEGPGQRAHMVAAASDYAYVLLLVLPAPLVVDEGSSPWSDVRRRFLSPCLFFFFSSSRRRACSATMSLNSLEWLNMSASSFLGESCQAGRLKRERFLGGAAPVGVASVMAVAKAWVWYGGG